MLSTQDSAFFFKMNITINIVASCLYQFFLHSLNYFFELLMRFKPIIAYWALEMFGIILN